MIRESECRQITGLCRMHRYNLEKQGKFPSRRQLGGRSVGWLLSEINEWIQKQPASTISGDNEVSLEKLTPFEFWTSVKILAEQTLAENTVLSLHGLAGEKQHLEAIASLSSLLRGQAGDHPYAWCGTEGSSNYIFGKDINK
jgi:prophage regulatory protein